MNLPFDFRVGNIIDYSGSLGNYYSVRVIEITPFDETRQMFTLERPYEEGKTFAGYTENIRPIFLREGHLSSLGFQFDDKLKRHTHNHLIIGSFGYAEGNDPMNMTYVSLGYRIIPNGFPNIPTIDQVKNHTIEIPYLHTLQNYCSDKNIADLDFTVIK
jgi:hypothetical protein